MWACVRAAFLLSSDNKLAVYRASDSDPSTNHRSGLARKIIKGAAFRRRPGTIRAAPNDSLAVIVSNEDDATGHCGRRLKPAKWLAQI